MTFATSSIPSIEMKLIDTAICTACRQPKPSRQRSMTLSKPTEVSSPDAIASAIVSITGVPGWYAWM